MLEEQEIWREAEVLDSLANDWGNEIYGVTLMLVENRSGSVEEVLSSLRKKYPPKTFQQRVDVQNASTLSLRGKSYPEIIVKITDPRVRMLVEIANASVGLVYDIGECESREMAIQMNKALMSGVIKAAEVFQAELKQESTP